MNFERQGTVPRERPEVGSSAACIQVDQRARIAVVHLVRRANDLSCFRAFIEAYRRNPAGLPHDLILVPQGFEPGEDVEVRAIADGTDWVALSVPDVGRDIDLYLAVARALDYEAFCFINFFSRPLAPDWLQKLNCALDDMPDAGIVGSTGTWWRPTRDQPFPNYNIRTNGFVIRRDVLLSLDLREMRGRRDVVRFEVGLADNRTD